MEHDSVTVSMEEAGTQEGDGLAWRRPGNIGAQLLLDSGQPQRSKEVLEKARQFRGSHRQSHGD